jgi:hypothetical protein
MFVSRCRVKTDLARRNRCAAALDVGEDAGQSVVTRPSAAERRHGAAHLVHGACGGLDPNRHRDPVAQASFAL